MQMARDHLGLGRYGNNIRASNAVDCAKGLKPPCTGCESEHPDAGTAGEQLLGKEGCHGFVRALNRCDKSPAVRTTALDMLSICASKGLVYPRATSASVIVPA